ncbi:MAG: hypothetical protein Q8L14_14310 [Myxococcales bacterium]|nr:hypothetical protein [Myxococcales bacterium]
MPLRLLASLVLLLLVGCPAAPSELSTTVIGRCSYTGPQSKLAECKDYLGAWKVADSEKDCGDLKGTFVGGTVCTPPVTLGFCVFATSPAQNRTYIASDNVSKCSGARTGCELFGGGKWNPSSLCGGANDEIVVLENAFQEPKKVCFTPDAGEPRAPNATGQVCVWESIHGSTEENRSFRTDARCENSRGGRPYYPKDADARFGMPDSRRTDQVYLAEEAWVRAQINSSSCVCCHSAAAPNGASIFDVDRDGSLANQLTDRGIAHGSGLVNSIPLGGFPPEVNNGFEKSDLVHPDFSVFLSTDPARMKRFWVKEQEHRNLTAATFEGVPDGFGPLSEQRDYQPSACAGGEGIAADGTITWGKGRARYVYVLEVGSKAPTVFPNLDVPVGTRWRLDVPHDGTPLVSQSVKYGVVPDGLRQKVPASGSPAALVSGQQYYLYVTADVMLPITRCLFTAP